MINSGNIWRYYLISRNWYGLNIFQKSFVWEMSYSWRNLRHDHAAAVTFNIQESIRWHPQHANLHKLESDFMGLWVVCLSVYEAIGLLLPCVINKSQLKCYLVWPPAKCLHSWIWTPGPPANKTSAPLTVLMNKQRNWISKKKGDVWDSVRNFSCLGPRTAWAH